MAPGSRLLAFASRWFDERTVARVFEPLLADYQREWAERARSGRAWIRVRGTAAFVIAVLALTPRALVLTPTPPSMTRRVLARIVIFSSAASVLLTIPFLVQMRELPMLQFVAAAVTILPASLILAFPFAMPWVADGIRRHGQPTPFERVAALRVAIIAVVFVVVVTGWVIPITNQQFRMIAAPEPSRPPARSARELTITELMSDASTAVVDGRYTRNGSRGAIRRELNNRAVMAVLPALLLWMRWSALNRTRRAPAAVATVLAIAVFFTLYFSSMRVEHALNLGVGTALWMPILALGFWGLAERRVA